MDIWDLARAAEEVSELLSFDTAHDLLSALEGSQPGPSVRRALRHHAPVEVQGLIGKMIDASGLDRACVSLAAAVSTRRRIEAETERIEVVWTGPASVPVSSHRPTAAVMHELIASAKAHITLATYSAGKVDDVIAALDQRRREGVDIRLLLETPRSDGSGPDCPEVFEKLVPYVNALEWPRNSRADHDWSSMHVKVLIRDDDAVLVTSANFSEAAMRNNMELGVVLHGGTIAATLRKHFDELEDTGTLRSL